MYTTIKNNTSNSCKMCVFSIVNDKLMIMINIYAVFFILFFHCFYVCVQMCVYFPIEITKFKNTLFPYFIMVERKTISYEYLTKVGSLGLNGISNCD